MRVILLAGAQVLAGTALAQTDSQVQLAFRNLRSDNIPGNAAVSATWIYNHRSGLRAAMIDEIYRTDRQAEDALMFSLFATKSFVPDERFARLVIARINQEDTQIKQGALGFSAHWAAWPFMEKHYALFKPLLMANLQTTTDMWALWGSITLLAKRNDLEAELPNFQPHVWNLAAKSLEDDRTGGNAGQAARFYLTIGKPSLPHLQPLTKARDEQTRSLATAIIDAMGGSQRAYGYLLAILNLQSEIFKAPQANPEWLDREFTKWAKPEGPGPYR